MFWFLTFLFGLSVGSFLNCLVYRVNNDLSFYKGRSLCDHCKKQLRWYDNLPIVSFLLLKGKCRFCHSPISWQYPLVELATGILTILIFNFGVFNLLISYFLLAIFLSDLNYQTIPDHFVYPAFFLALVSQYHNILISIIAAGFFWLLHFFTRGRGMALGDVKLAGLMGLFLGWPKILIALYLAFLTGALVGVILVLLKKKKLKQHIAFGPFLVLATFIVLFWGEKIWLKIMASLW